jgi:hypothetical protein
VGQQGQTIKQSFEQRAKRLGLGSRSGQPNQHHHQFFDRLRGIPFWIGDPTQHSEAYSRKKPFCCFNHAVGLPEKNGTPMGLFPYQELWFNCLMQESKYLWIKKPTSIGATTFFLRWMVWMATRNDDMKDKEMAIVVGPNIDLAVGLISKIRQLFISQGITFDDKQTEVTINNCLIKAYPSNHLNAMRSRMDLKVIYCDEAAFFEQGQQAILRDVLERYIAKSNPHIIITSTAGAPDDLFAQMDQEETSIYKRFRLDYRTGLGYIYTDEEIAQAKKSPSFAREYEGIYMGLVGNVFGQDDIKYAVEVLGKSYAPHQVDGRTPKALALDPAYGGSSAFGLVLTEQVSPNRINVLLASEFERPSHEEMVQKVLNIISSYGNVKKCYVDASATAMITSLKEAFNEVTNWPQQIKDIQSKHGGKQISPTHYKEWMRIVPCQFSTDNGKDMLAHAKMLLEYRVVAIAPVFDKLVAALTTAQESEGKLLKRFMSHSDVFDGFRMLAGMHYSSVYSREAADRIKKVQDSSPGITVPVASTTTRAEQSALRSHAVGRREIWDKAFNV